MPSRPSMIAMMLGSYVKLAERPCTCTAARAEHVPAGAGATDQIEVFAWPRDGFETFGQPEGLHDILED